MFFATLDMCDVIILKNVIVYERDIKLSQKA